MRMFLSSLTGLATWPDCEPSHKWLGYFQPEASLTGTAAAGGWQIRETAEYNSALVWRRRCRAVPGMGITLA
jgi:hypothetical protein